MGETLTKANVVFRDFVEESIPSTGPWEPPKPDVRELFDIIDTALEGAAAGSFSRKTWAAPDGLAGLFPTQNGAKGEVTDDAGTHTDPVVGGTVNNKGTYSYHTTAPIGWERTDDYVPSQFNTRIDALELRVDHLLTIGGTADVITATANPTMDAYVTNARFWFVAAATNTGAVTMNINGLGARALVGPGGATLAANQLAVGRPYIARVGVADLQIITGDLNQIDALELRADRFLTTIGGTANAVTGVGHPTFLSYVENVRFWFVAALTNTDSMTINIDGLGVRALVGPEGLPLTEGQIVVGKPYLAKVGATNLQVIAGPLYDTPALQRQSYGTIDQPILFEDDIFPHAHTTLGEDGITEEMVGGVIEDGSPVFHTAPYDFKCSDVYVSPTNVEVRAMLAYGVGVQSNLGTILRSPEPYIKRRIRAIMTDFAGNDFPVILDPFNDFAISLHTTIKELEIIVYWGASNAVGPTTSVPFELGPQVGTAALQGNAQNLIAVGGEDESTVIADTDFNLDPEAELAGFTNLHNTVLERPAVAFGNALVRRRYRSRILGQRRVIFTVGKGGKSVTEIGAGTVQYNNIIVAMQRIRALAIRDFGCNRFRVRMVTVQGEADTTMAVATYQAHLQELFDDFEADMATTFNSNTTIPTVLVGPVRFYMVQDGLVGASGQGGNPALALVNLHDGDKYILASHGYDATFADFVHRDGPGNQHVHEKVAMAFSYREYRGLPWPILKPATVTYNAGTQTVSFSFPASPEGTYVESDQGGPSGSDEFPPVADGRLGINIVTAAAPTAKLATSSITFPGAGVVNVVMTAPLAAATAHILKIGRFRPETVAGTLRPPYEGVWTNLRAESAEVSTGADNNGRLQHYYVPQSETLFTTPA